jgi:hypothetical protein
LERNVIKSSENIEFLFEELLPFKYLDQQAKKPVTISDKCLIEIISIPPFKRNHRARFILM